MRFVALDIKNKHEQRQRGGGREGGLEGKAAWQVASKPAGQVAACWTRGAAGQAP